MSAYSSALAYMLDRLSGFSCNNFRLETQGSDSATASKILRFTLPSNSLLNLRSFALHFNMSADNTAAQGGRLPAKIETVVERVEVSVGGIQLSAGSNFYNVLAHAKQALMGDKSDPILGHPDVVRTISYVDGSTITGTNNEVYPSANKQTQFCIDHWEGFLGTCEPKLFDSALVPDIVIAIYLADNTILTTSAGINLAGDPAVAPAFPFNIATPTAAASWTMNNIHATIECCGLNSNVYDNMVENIIATKGALELPFKNYVSFQDTTVNSTRFSVATQSLDRLWVVWRNNAYNVQNAPIVVSGYKVFDTAFNSAGKCTYDSGGSLNTNKEKYISVFSQFVEPPTVSKNLYQLSLNGSYYPQYQSSAEEMFQISRNSVEGTPQHEYGLDTMKNNYFVQCIRLNLPDSENSRLISGLNTLGVSLNAFYYIYNASATRPVNIFAECSSVLRIGSGKQLEVVM
jgi:hypothetical protein